MHYKNTTLKNIEYVKDGCIIEEEWKYLYNDTKYDYMVSSLGRVKSMPRRIILKTERSKGSFYIKKERILKQNSNGPYLRVQYPENGKFVNALVHRIIALTFISNKKHLDVNHINGNKYDNRITNLELVTKKENMDHAKLNNLLKPPTGSRNYMFGKTLGKHPNSKKILQIDKHGKVIAEYDSILSAQNQTNFAKQNICKVLKGKRNLCGGFKWKYKK